MSNSSATLQSYTHYAFIIPNRDTEIISSGNYVLSVFDDKQELIFTKRFVVYEQQANVQVGVFRLRDEIIQYFPFPRQGTTSEVGRKEVNRSIASLLLTLFLSI